MHALTRPLLVTLAFLSCDRSPRHGPLPSPPAHAAEPAPSPAPAPPAAPTANSPPSSAAAAPPVDSAAPAPSHRDETLELYVDGARAGTVHAVDVKLPNGGWRLERKAHMEVKRGELALVLDSESTAEVTADFRPVSFNYVRTEAGGKLVNQGRAACRADTCDLVVDIIIGNARSSRTVSMGPGVTFASAVEVQARQQLKNGASWKGQALVEELGQLQAADYAVAADGKNFRITSHTAGVESIDIVTPEGRAVRSEVPALNAVAVPQGSPPPAGGSKVLDVLAKSTWRGPVFPRNAAVVRFTLTSDADLAAIPEDRHQRVITREPRRVIVEVTRAATGMPETLSDADRRRALAATPYEPIADPRVKSAAQEARGEAKTPRDIVRNVTMWVNQHVDEKNLSRAYAPATATLESRQGDCTEHSVLTSALLKASGIPVRLADGVIAFDGKLGYHEWIEVFLDGEGWVPVDPTFGEPEAGANRVKFANGSSDPGDLMAMGLSAAQAFRGLQVTAEAVNR